MPSSRLPVFLLVRTAFHLLWRRKDDALRLGFVPTLICFGGIVYGQDALRVVAAQLRSGLVDQPPPGISLAIMATLLIVMLATALAVANWLRFMLLGPMGAVGLGLNIGRPHVSFIVWSFVLLFAASIAFTVLCMPILLLPGLLAGIGIVVACIVVIVLAARLSPFVVGQVIAQPMTLQQAWIASRGNGAPLAMALILVQVPLLIGVELIGQILFVLGFASAAPLAMFFIGAVFQTASALLMAIVLATAFRHMVGIKV